MRLIVQGYPGLHGFNPLVRKNDKESFTFLSFSISDWTHEIRMNFKRTLHFEKRLTYKSRFGYKAKKLVLLLYS